jgi:hypothetical protein
MAPLLFLDPSALLRRYLKGAGHDLVVAAMDAAEAWCGSPLCRTETQLALHLAAAHPAQQERLWAALRRDWEAFWVVPLDGRCLARATEWGSACAPWTPSTSRPPTGSPVRPPT